MCICLTTGKDDSTQGPLRDYFEIIISDTGVGIEEDKIEKIFERFYQIDGNEANFGTGIGLHLARSLVQIQYGIIYARNRKGRSGSEFIIRMSLGNKHLKESEKENNGMMAVPLTEAKKTKSKTKYRILIVDDEDEIRHYLAAELLRNQKLTISEIAYALGFTNLSHFSNSFREFYGISPTEYMKNITPPEKMLEHT